MRFFVSGSSGFIGQHLLKYLAGLGHEVKGLFRELHVELYILNTQEPFEFIHLAAYGNHYNQTEHKQIIKANIEAVHNIASFLHDCENCHKLYNISTSAIQLQKDTLYSVSKRFGELMVDSYQDPRFVNIRPYSVYGPGEAAHRFIPTVIRALQTGETIQLDENAKHDWIFVEDFIEAMFAGYTNIGTGISYTNLDIVWILEHILGKKLNYTPAKLRSYDTTDWVCPVKDIPHRSIEEGLKQTYEFFARKDN